MSSPEALLGRAINVMFNLKDYLKAIPDPVAQVYLASITDIMSDYKVIGIPKRRKFLNDPESKQRAIKFAHELSIATEERDPEEGFGWDTKSIATGGDRDAGMIVHDACHWLVSPKSRRKLVEFGLGSGVDTGNDKAADAAKVVRYPHDEEILASWLGILWERKLRMNWIASADDQNWINGEKAMGLVITDIHKVMNRLGRRRLINAAGEPVLSKGPRVSISQQIVESLVMECVR